MRFQRFGDRYIVRLMNGEPLIETLAGFLEREQIGFANLSAAGAVRWARLAYWNEATKRYEAREFNQQMEVVSFQGNVALKDDKPFLHVHGVFGLSDFTVIGGHIQEATVHPTLEVWLRAEDVPVHRGPIFGPGPARPTAGNRALMVDSPLHTWELYYRQRPRRVCSSPAAGSIRRTSYGCIRRRASSPSPCARGTIV